MNAFELLIILSQRSFHKSFCYIVTDACTIQSSGEFSGTWEALWGPLLAVFFVFCFLILTGLDLSSGVAGQVSLAVHGEQALLSVSRCDTQA